MPGEIGQEPGLHEKKCSILMSDNHVKLSGVPDKSIEALSKSYKVLQDKYELKTDYNSNDNALQPTQSTSFLLSPKFDGSIDIEERSNQFPAPENANFAVGTRVKNNMNLENEMNLKRKIHLQSADLFDNFSPVQRERSLWKPTLPISLEAASVAFVENEAEELEQQDSEKLGKLFPNIFTKKCLDFCPLETTVQKNEAAPNIGTAYKSPGVVEAPGGPLRVGIVLSGGPAPGGHNVIAGLYDYLKRHVESQLYGFMGGLDGLLKSNFTIVNDAKMSRFRNQGGFDMLWSGRGKLKGKEDLEAALKTCKDLSLQGLVIVGGDGSLSNAAILAEYFAENLGSCHVCGVPKTIDGDLKNNWIEISFGFDTAVKTYSELIGNLCIDVKTGQDVYHFVRLMGRSASHIVAECALQTRPNIVLLGEEIEANGTSLKQVVFSIVDLIITRKAIGKLFGMVLVPEGLIEFIPEIKTLIDELNNLVTHEPPPEAGSVYNNLGESLSAESRDTWEFLPDTIKEQLLTDRESSGYIQVAKIATERLLKLLTLDELRRRNVGCEDIAIMTHYFGYEGRCAMPSNFDATFCYDLGLMTGYLIKNKKNGYVSTVRHLHLHPSMWVPAAIPFTRIMQIKRNNGKSFAAIIRQLLDLNSPLFRRIKETRERWRLDDCYSSPGPIQFEGPLADMSNFTVLLSSPVVQSEGISRCKEDRSLYDSCPNKVPDYSPLQNYRLQQRLEIPAVCYDLFARAVPTSQYVPKDIFSYKQIILNYPYISNKTEFRLHEVVRDLDTQPVGKGLRVGIIFLSRQAPGVNNILWGLQNRLKLVNGVCIGFYGVDGLLNSRYVDITDEILEPYKNQGGMELLGRTNVHSLLLEENQMKALDTCRKLQLDGLVVVGSSLAMTEGALLAEYFLSRNCPTSVIGIPATGSKSLSHELIETNIGFDTSSKVYASLIGNILADAASMPKYWHFIRLMGRHPSNEVLECALQTHPNLVIVAEEYGCANKTLWDVVTDIADVVCKRAEMGKNFGTVLIPDGLLSHIPNMKSLLKELTILIRKADKVGELRQFQEELEMVEEIQSLGKKTIWLSRITPWSLAVYTSLPKFIRKELIDVYIAGTRLNLVETELLLSQMVEKELNSRHKEGKFIGKFAAVCHFFGYQGRSSLPSCFDAQLAFACGHLASICIESGLSGLCCTVRGLCSTPSDWKLGAIPFPSMMRFTFQLDDVYDDLRSPEKDVPIIPSAEVDLNGKAYKWMRIAVGQWQLEDRFCNPGPIQFDGKAAMFYHRILHEEQAEYFNMMKQAQVYARILADTCSFGVDYQFLKAVFTCLSYLLTLRFHPDDLISFLPGLADVEGYEAWQRNKGKRPDVCHTEDKDGTDHQ